jgi:hypothetical protein
MDFSIMFKAGGSTSFKKIPKLGERNGNNLNIVATPNWLL